MTQLTFQPLTSASAAAINGNGSSLFTLVASEVDITDTTKYTYYPGGLLNSEDGPWLNDTVTYTYNNARMRSGLVLQQPAGTWTNGFVYDPAKRLTNLTSQAGAFAYSYSAGVEWPLVTGGDGEWVAAERCQRVGGLPVQRRERADHSEQPG